MEASFICRNRTLVNNVPNESRASKKSEGIEQLVNLYRWPSALHKVEEYRQRLYHRVRYIWMNGPDVPFHEK